MISETRFTLLALPLRVTPPEARTRQRSLVADHKQPVAGCWVLNAFLGNYKLLDLAVPLRKYLQTFRVVAFGWQLSGFAVP
jgi:hypothetical protein